MKITNMRSRKVGTFSLNKGEPIHRWYPYIEGYSSCLIEDILRELSQEHIHSIYDPFGGTGTTMLVASQRGIRSYYSEINPFMCEIIDTKINVIRSLSSRNVGTKTLRDFLKITQNLTMELQFGDCQWNGFEKFFSQPVLSQILDLKQQIERVKDEDSRKILKLAFASVIVRCSLMIRRGDLRVAKPEEKIPEDHNVLANYTKKLEEIIEDIDHFAGTLTCDTERLTYDSRDITAENLFDCVITSPPYLNGTNYIRNTKIELKLFDFVDTEDDLPQYHSRGIIAGINNISKRNENLEILPCVKPYIDKLAPVAYDKRIPLMVSGYFSDMKKVIIKLAHGLRDNGIFIMDIGDSQFAGVHIPTHEILAAICAECGFEKYAEQILRVRHSNNGMELSQRLLKFRLKKSSTNKTDFKDMAKQFMSNLPYKQEPFAGRNWGHSWHSLCSYHGKLKPAIAHFLISEFTQPGDVVLDPLSGVGTIPFEACLQGRIGIGNDLSEMAFVVSRAKLEKPEYSDVEGKLEKLADFIQAHISSSEVFSDQKLYSNFGYNKTIPEYFHPDTLKEILAARRFFYGRYFTLSSSECMVLSAFLHVLHGNRPYALSRTSHPLTPYAPKGDFIYKNVIEHIREKVKRAYEHVGFSEYRSGKAIWGDFSLLTDKEVKADFVICSPPFADSIRFYMQNWMRLWLCGWEKEDFQKADNIFLDAKQRKHFEIYGAFFQMCSRVLSPRGKVILHLGKTEKIDMAEELAKQAAPYFEECYRAAESVSDIERHGIKDKGGTVAHQFLFLKKL